MESAPRTARVEIPLAPDLRPYYVLQAEPERTPLGSRFPAHWVTVWKSRIPCVQIDTARSWPVGRALAPVREDDPASVAKLLADAALFVTTETDRLALAAKLQVPTVFLADGLATEGLPRELVGFEPSRLRVVRADGAFRRELPLRRVHAAIEALLPGMLDADLSESRASRQRLAPWLRGAITDLGHGGHKIDPAAIGVDQFRYDDFDVIGDVRDLWSVPSESFDTVYSSHCLEDLWQPHQALAEWTRVLKPGGHLVLWLPLRGFYPSVGSPDANPGHKDDYVPEDVEGFLRDLGQCEVVHSARVESELSFEVVAKKTSRRSFLVQREQRPAPRVSVLVVGAVGPNPAGDGAQLRATVAAAHRSLGDVPHELLVLARQRLPDEELAALRDLGARLPACGIVEDRRPSSYPARLDRLFEQARGEAVVILAPGALPLGDALRVLDERARAAGAALARPRTVDPAGAELGPDELPAACLWLRRDAWPAGLAGSPYRGPELWRALEEQLGRPALLATEAVVVTGGRADESVLATRLGDDAFDQQLRTRRVPPRGGPVARLLVVMLRTLGDAVLALPVVRALRARHPEARLTVLTEQQYAWLYEHDPAVDEVLAAPSFPGRELHWREDQLVASAVRAGGFDRVAWLTPRGDDVPYHHGGLTLQRFYAAQAGVDDGFDHRPGVVLGSDARERAARTLASFEVGPRYVALHCRAGWPEKSLTEALALELVEHLSSRHGLPVVVVGGPGEIVAHPMCLNLAGHLEPAVSAAVIAGARLFVGPDSGLLHLASAFDVPSLALYAGSSARVAPPLAAQAVSVQAPGACAVPCGVTPCAERRPCADTLPVDTLRAHADALLRGEAGRSEWLGAHPAAWQPGPDGPWLGTEPAAGEPLGVVVDPAPVPRVTPAPVIAFGLDLPPCAEHERQVHALRAARAAAGPAERERHTARIVRELENAGGLPALELLESLALSAQAAGLGELATDVVLRAFTEIDALARGARGRARPAARLRAAATFALGANGGRSFRLPVERLEALVVAHRRATGEWPALLPIGLWLERLADETLPPPPALPALRACLLAAVPEQTHAAALQAARLLDRLGDSAGAIDALEARGPQLPAHDLERRRALRFVLGLLRARDPRTLAAALTDLRAVLHSEADAPEVREAGRLVAQIENLLARAATAGPARPRGSS